MSTKLGDKCLVIALKEDDPAVSVSTLWFPVHNKSLHGLNPVES